MKKIASLFYFSSNITRLPKRAPGNTSRVQRPYSKKHEIMRWDLRSKEEVNIAST